MGSHRSWRGHGLCVIALSMACSAGAAGSLQLGVSMLYKDDSGRQWCVTVVSMDTGVDGEAWAWFTVNDDQRRIGHARVAELKSHCPSRNPGPT